MCIYTLLTFTVLVSPWNSGTMSPPLPPDPWIPGLSSPVEGGKTVTVTLLLPSVYHIITQVGGQKSMKTFTGSDQSGVVSKSICADKMSFDPGSVQTWSA